MSFKGKCLGSNVIVKPVENEQITQGGLDFTSVVDKNQKWGKGIVVSIGENVPKDIEGKPYIEEGDTILYDRNKASDYVEETIEYKAMYYADIFKKF